MVAEMVVGLVGNVNGDGVGHSPRDIDSSLVIEDRQVAISSGDTYYS